MGLFDRFRAPADGLRLASGAGQPTRPLAPVPDLDDVGPTLDAAVRHHMERLTQAAQSDVESLSPQEFDDALTARLVSRERLHATGLGFDYTVPFTQHVDEVLTLDLPLNVITLPGSRLTAAQHHVPSLFQRGRTNLQARMQRADVDLVRLRSGRRTCHAIVGDSPYTASFARFLPDVVERWMPRTDMSNGVIFALPHRHAIVLQSCASPADTRAALELVPEQATHMYATGRSPVTPHVYHYYHRQITCLTVEQEDGTLAVRPTALVEGMLGRAARKAG